MTTDEEDALMQRVLQRKHDKEMFKSIFQAVVFWSQPPTKDYTANTLHLRKDSGAHNAAQNMGMTLRAPAWMDEFKVLLDRLMIEHPELVPDGVGVDHGGEGEE